MTETETQASAPPLYLAADLTVRDQYKLLPYAAEVRPLMARFGGEIRGFSAAGHHLLEGDWKPGPGKTLPAHARLLDAK